MSKKIVSWIAVCGAIAGVSTIAALPAIAHSANNFHHRESVTEQTEIHHRGTPHRGRGRGGGNGDCPRW
ncbi:hypothetical protein [Phormidium sp. CCY1219]|uniref:hypothetical protein n=1 Tax=Phormidium sp. CCY1219 TaxID=2886104 RepID=UPI002D1E7A6E|nr:hypothetical protein [Phormidium sp. CCY1219]MEB3828661.1 hypothetical protein [Phormidium sp. CCY1219]